MGYKKLRNKKINCFLMAVILIITCVFTFNPVQKVLAASVSENRSRESELNSKNAQLKEQIDVLREDVQKQSEYKVALDNQVATVQEQIDIINEKVYSLDKEIESLQSKIEDTQIKINKNFELLKKRLRTIYMAGDTSTMDIILGAKDFSDFVDKAEMVKNISDHDSQLIDELKNDIESISSEKERIESDRATTAIEKSNLDSKKAELDSLMQESEQVMSELQGKQSAIQDCLDENDEELKQIRSEISAYYEEQAALERAAQKSSSGEEYVSTTGSNGYVWPAPGFYYISSTFNESRGSKIHGALDIAGSGIYGTPVLAAQSGTVRFSNSSGWGGGYGNYVSIGHENGYSTLYAHMSRIVVSRGDTVSRGQVIGYVGSTGASTGPHLHFETMHYGNLYDPMLEY